MYCDDESSVGHAIGRIGSGRQHSELLFSLHLMQITHNNCFTFHDLSRFRRTNCPIGFCNVLPRRTLIDWGHVHHTAEVEAPIWIGWSWVDGKPWFWVVEEDTIKMWGDVVGMLKEEQWVFGIDGSSIIYSFFSFLSSHYMLSMLLLPHLFDPLLIILALSSSTRCFFLLHLVPLRLFVEIWKEFSLREGPQSCFKITDDLDGHFELLFFKHEAFLLLIDHLDGLLHPIVEIQRKCP